MLPKILVVDDEPSAIETLCYALNGMGDLRYATSGSQALAMLADDPATLILLDARMPGMDGFTTCATLRRDFPDTPVIFVTAANDPDTELRALASGARDFITKPINPPLVRARVNLHLQIKEYENRLHALIRQDPLTGIANRQALDEQLNLGWKRALRRNRPISLLMMDIDHFKAYNDHYGHPQGDDCLRHVAKAIAASLRQPDDLVARYGGEEFVVLLADVSANEASGIGERIRTTVEGLAIPHVASSIAECVTLSIGVSSCHPSYQTPCLISQTLPAADTNPQTLIRGLLNRADKALYTAKTNGRNRVFVDTY